MLTELDTEILTQIVASVFETMMSLIVVECEQPLSPSGDKLTAAVHMNGDWNGALLLECDCGEACRLAGRFLSIEAPETVNDDVRDVFGELANMIGGNMKFLIAPGTHLSTPSVIDGADYGLRLCRSEIRDRLGFRCEEGYFWVTVLEAM